jgi:hypothetical protein
MFNGLFLLAFVTQGHVMQIIGTDGLYAGVFGGL